MGNLIIAAGKLAIAVFSGTAAGGGAAGALIQAAAITATSLAVNKIAASRLGSNQDQPITAREVSIRSGTEYAKIIYGESMVGGVLRYTGVNGSESQFLWRSEILAGHEIEDIAAIKIDETFISGADIDWNTNIVTGGFFQDYVKVYKQLGLDSQTVTPELDNAFASITTDHRARGRALLEVKLEWVEASNSIWQQLGPPNNILGLVKGQPGIYDPRLDAAPGDSPASSSYQAYTNNPILQLCHYLTDEKLGMGEFIGVDDIDWQWMADEAEYCEMLAPSPGSIIGEPRFTSNGSMSAGSSYKENIKTLLSACSGIALQKRGSKWIARSGRFGYGANLCSNPNFENDIAGWTKQSGSGTVSHNSNLKLLALENSSGGRVTAAFSFPVVAGTIYSARAMALADSEITAANAYGLAATYNPNGQGSKLASHEVNAFGSELRIQFKAETTGTIYVSLYINSISANKTAEFKGVEIYKVTDVTITDDWLVDDWQQVSDGGKETHYNAVDAIYVSPQQGYKPIESLRQENGDYLSRDNGQLMPTEIKLGMTNTEFEAQRLAFRKLNASDYKEPYRLPCNYFALDVLPYDVVNINIPSISPTEFTARVEPVEFNDMGANQGIVLLVRAEDVHKYADPDVSDYSTRTESGDIVLAISEVPAPTAPSAEGREGGILNKWVNPNIATLWDFVQVYASTTDDRDNAVLIYDGKVSEHFHKLENGETYFYWYRARRGQEYSQWLPNTQTTTLTATAGNQIAAAASTANWSGITDDVGSGTTPDRSLEDIQREAFNTAIDLFRQSLVGAVGGYTGAEKVITDVVGGPDGANVLIDALDGTIDGLKFDGGVLVNDRIPAQGGATANTGPLLSDSFQLSATLTAAANPINTFTQIRDGSTPVSLLSGQTLRFDEAGTYILTFNFSFDYRLDTITSGSGIPSSIQFQVYTRYAADGITYASPANYQYWSDIKPASSVASFATQFGSIGSTLIIDAAEDSTLQLYFNPVNANGFNVRQESRVDILQLKQVAD